MSTLSLTIKNKDMQQYLQSYLFRALGLSVWLFFITPSAGATTFLDVDTTHPYFHAIDSLTTKKIIQGHQLSDPSKKVFQPRQNLNRAEALKITLLASQTELLNQQTSSFPDVTPRDWFFPYVITATNQNIVQGFPSGDFRPGNFVTRVEFLKMTLRAFEVPLLPAQEDQRWYEPFLDKALKLNLLPESQKPAELLSRGEAAEILYRLAHLQKDNFALPYRFLGSGLASYYNEGFAGRKTANGEVYDPYDLTAAHRTLPFNTKIKVYNQAGDWVIVRINDRGPYHKSRVLDLSEKAFSELAPISRGVLSITFEIYREPTDRVPAVPENLRSEISPELKNAIIPPVVEQAITGSLSEFKGEPLPLFEESITWAQIDFFETATLRKPFPQLVPQGYVWQLSGRTNEPKNKVTVFVQNQASGEQAIFSTAVSGQNFSVPVPLTEVGKFQVGMVFDEQTRSRVAEIEVRSNFRRNIYPKHFETFQTRSQIEVIPEAQKVRFTIPSRAGRLTKLEWLGGNRKRELFLPGGLGQLELPYNFWELFDGQTLLKLKVYQAASQDNTLFKQISNWHLVDQKDWQLAQSFPDIAEKKVVINDFQRYRRTLDPIRYSGQKKTSQQLHDQAFITKPNGLVKAIPIVFHENGQFELSFVPQNFGRHIVEIVAKNGEILFNRALYLSENPVLPVLKDTQTPINYRSQRGIFNWVNQLRTDHHLHTLVSDTELNQIAKSYAERMAREGFLSHTDPEGRNVGDRIAHLSYRRFAENLSFGSNLQLALDGLANSGSHRQNLLGSRWGRAGIGVAQNKKGDFLVVQIFTD